MNDVGSESELGLGNEDPSIATTTDPCDRGIQLAVCEDVLSEIKNDLVECEPEARIERRGIGEP